MNDESKKWKVLRQTPVIESPWFKVAKEKVELPGGHIIEDFYTVKADDLICILALNEAGQVAFIRQYRHGIQKIMLEIPGGVVDAGESSLAAAKRELAEETGLVSNNWHKIAHAYLDPARSNVGQDFYLALNATVDSSLPKPEFEPQFIEIEEAYNNAENLGIIGMSTIMALSIARSMDLRAIGQGDQ
jgi:ADP-ribose pyrophosphatase